MKKVKKEKNRKTMPIHTNSIHLKNSHLKKRKFHKIL